MPREKILIVDDEPAIRVMLTEALNDCGYTCVTACDGAEAMEVLQQQKFDLVVSDILMPRMDGRSLLKELKAKYPDLPVVVLSAVDDVQNAIDLLTGGAENYLLKPIQLLELSIAIERALEKGKLVRENKAYQQELEKKIEDKTLELRQTLHYVENLCQGSLDALVAALDAREHETQNHSQRVARYTTFLAEKVGVPHHGLAGLYPGALLHDIGKIGISDSILLKRGRLTKEEQEIIRQHPEIGARIVARIGLTAVARSIVLYHHERWDGKGYPRGVQGDQVPVPARIFSIADTLDGITSDRPYRKARSWNDAREEILRCRGTQFDPDLVNAFLSIPAAHFKSLREEVMARGAIEVYGAQPAPPPPDTEDEPAISNAPSSS